MRIYCFVILFGFAPCYGDRTMGEDFADGRARFLIGFHRYGGLLAFALGLAMVAWCSRRLTSRADRAGNGPS